MPQSDPTFVDHMFKYGWPALIGLFGWQGRQNKELHGRISRVKDQLTDHEKSSLRDFATKDDHKELVREIRMGFKELGQKIDGKADK